jgi:rRNA-processing protein EBP2
MGKKNVMKAKKSAPKVADASPTKKEAKRLVTMAALEAMSDSEDDGGMPPEGEWGADAKALKKAIEAGAFETILNAYKEGEDDESIEEVNLDDVPSDDEDGDDGSEDSGDEQGEEVEEGDEEEEGVSEESEGEEEEEEDDNSESDSPAKAADKPRHKKSSLASKDDEEEDEQAEAEEDDDDDEEKEESENVNSKAIRVVTEDLIAARNAMPWAESFAITPATTSPFGPGAEELLDIHDDLKREVAFYDIAMEAALAAKKACEGAKVPFSRPEDFFAEMVKTDGKDRFSDNT